MNTYIFEAEFENKGKKYTRRWKIKGKTQNEAWQKSKKLWTLKGFTGNAAMQEETK